MTDGPTPRRGSPAITDEQWETFLNGLRKTANVVGACRLAGIGSAETARRHKKADPGFSEAWEAALLDAREELIGVLFAVSKGVRRYEISHGKVVRDPTDETKPLTYVEQHPQTAQWLLSKLDERFRRVAGDNSDALPPELTRDPEPIPDEPGPDNPIL